MSRQPRAETQRRQFFMAVGLLVLVSACVPRVTATPLGPAKHYDPTPDSVAVPLYTTSKPDCAYDEIAAISAEIAIGRGSDEKVTEAMRQRARGLGADAIVGYSQGARELIVGKGEGGTALTRSGTAIRFRSRDCMR